MEQRKYLIHSGQRMARLRDSFLTGGATAGALCPQDRLRRLQIVLRNYYGNMWVCDNFLNGEITAGALYPDEYLSRVHLTLRTEHVETNHCPHLDDRYLDKLN